MYLGEVSTAQLISVALMLLFAFAAIFFIGYKYSYDKAISYANGQIEEQMEEFREYYGFKLNPDEFIGNIKLPTLEEIRNG